MVKGRKAIAGKSVKDRQDAFLVAYGQTGTISAATKVVGITRTTVGNWVKGDKEGFRFRFEVAKEVFVENLENIALARIMEQKANDNPLLLITMLNAHNPDKYRRDGRQVGTEVKEMMVEWKKWTRAQKGGGKVRKESEGVTEDKEARKNAVNEVEKMLKRRNGQ